MQTQPLHARIMQALDEFDDRHPGWDLAIERLTIGPSSHHAGRAGISCFVKIVDGMRFEIPLASGDDVAATLGEVLH